MAPGEQVEMQDRQHRAVARGVRELVGMPARRQRAGLCLAVTDDAGDDEVGVVERRPVGVGQRITQLTAFRHRARQRADHHRFRAACRCA